MGAPRDRVPERVGRVSPMPSIEERVAAWRRELPDLEARILGPMLELLELTAVVEDWQQQLLAPFEIGRGEYEILSVLRRLGMPHRSSPSVLMRLVGCSSAGMTKRLKKLEARGLVLRSPDPDDGRGALVRLSPRGLELQERVLRSQLAAMQGRLEALGEGELEQVASGVRRLCELLRGRP